MTRRAAQSVPRMTSRFRESSRDIWMSYAGRVALRDVRLLERLRSDHKRALAPHFAITYLSMSGYYFLVLILISFWKYAQRYTVIK